MANEISAYVAPLLAIAYRDKSLELLSATDAAKEMKTAVQVQNCSSTTCNKGAARVPRLGNHLENI